LVRAHTTLALRVCRKQKK